ncbi:MAG: 1-acyl-sn-glycerol-3-phosphate acyltransferase [Phycisphaerales bacterium]|nr:1-acyl-sn-glycerol-3-phosphate acyltransferase [Phycisphaerales bacterium]
MRAGYAVCRALCQATTIFMFRTRLFGMENVPKTGPVLLVCNHQSYLDPVLVTHALPREGHYMARDTLFRGGPFDRLIRYLNAYPVRRGEADLTAMKETLRRLKNDALVTVFPEATRTLDGSIAPMRPGVVLLAKKAKAPIVPTLILGAFEAWPRQAKLPHPKPILIAYDPPILPEQMRETPDDETIATVRDRLEALRTRYVGHPMFGARTQG